MGYRFEQPEYLVSVDGGFVFPQLWLIHVAIAYRGDLGVEARGRLGREADLAVMRGVAHEANRAWSLGAKKVRVLIAGDGDLDRFFEVLKDQPIAAA